jgi:tetratricopeptide (TPR) repeat protein
MDEKLKFRAFISYSHTERDVSRRLHRHLERFRTPKELSGRMGRHGAVPEKLAPIFRDREELTTSPDLTGRIVEALKNSDHLIVLCSPASVASRWVNEEIKTFASFGRAERIHPVIVDGEPPDCFPPSMRSSAKGTEGETSEPLAADLRPQGDGWHDGVLKLTAGLLGINLGELRDREVVRARARARRNAIGATIFALLFVVALVSGTLAMRNASARTVMLGEAVRLTSNIVQRVVQFRDYLPRAVIGELLDDAKSGFDRLLAQEVDNGDLRAQYGRLALEFSRHYAVIGSSAQQLERARLAEKIFGELSETNPGNRQSFKPSLVAAWIEQGNALMTQGDLAGASAVYKKVSSVLVATDVGTKQLSIGESSAVPDPDVLRRAARDLSRMGLTRGISVAPISSASIEIGERWANAKNATKLGDIAFEEGRFSEALREFDSAHTAFSELAADLRLKPDFANNAELQALHRALLSDLGVADVRVADVLRESGQTELSIAKYERARDSFDMASKGDPNNRSYRRNIAVARARLGLAYTQIQKFSEATAALDGALAVIEALALEDPDNALWKRDLLVVRSNLGEAWNASGDSHRARSFFEQSETAADELIKLDPENVIWLHDLAVVRIQLGITALRSNDTAAAIAKLTYARTALTELVQRDPLNEVWRSEADGLAILIGSLKGN